MNFLAPALDLVIRMYRSDGIVERHRLDLPARTEPSATELRNFYYAQGCRREELLQQRLQRIRSADRR